MINTLRGEEYQTGLAYDKAEAFGVLFWPI